MPMLAYTYIEEQERCGNLLVICPDNSLNISRASKNPDELKRVYEIGRNVAQQKLDAIKLFLKNEKKKILARCARK